MTKIEQLLDQMNDKDKARGVTPRHRKARAVAGVALAASGLFAAYKAVEPVHNAANAVVHVTKEGINGMVDVAKSLNDPTEAELLRDKYKDMREHPEKVEPGTYVTYMVGDDENPSYVARLLSGEGVDDTELKNILVAQEDSNHHLQPGPVIVPVELIQSDDESLQTQLEPFPVVEQQ
jgi:hypothetical protein